MRSILDARKERRGRCGRIIQTHRQENEPGRSSKHRFLHCIRGIHYWRTESGEKAPYALLELPGRLAHFRERLNAWSYSIRCAVHI